MDEQAHQCARQSLVLKSFLRESVPDAPEISRGPRAAHMAINNAGRWSASSLEASWTGRGSDASDQGTADRPERRPDGIGGGDCDKTLIEWRNDGALKGSATLRPGEVGDELQALLMDVPCRGRVMENRGPELGQRLHAVRRARPRVCLVTPGGRAEKRWLHESRI
jgi:hypothetical protein